MIHVEKKRFMEQFEGKCRGKYHLAYLISIGIVGGDELRREARKLHGRPRYEREEMYPIREAAEMLMFASRRGVLSERIGEVAPAVFKRANPELFEGLTPARLFELICQRFTDDTTYGSSTRILELGPGHARIGRYDNPMPCEFFTGVIKGFFVLLRIRAEVRETRCQWREGTGGCIYDIVWMEENLADKVPPPRKPGPAIANWR